MVQVLTSRPRGKTVKSDDGVARLLHLEPYRDEMQQIYWDFLDLKHLGRLLRDWTPDVVALFHIMELTRSLLPFLAGQDVPLVYDEGVVGLLFAWQKRGGWWCSLRERQDGGAVKRALRRAFVDSSHRLSGRVLPREWYWPTNMLVYFNCEFNLRRHQEAGVPVSGARVLRSGVNLGRFEFRAGRRASEAPELLLPSRIVPRKGIEDAIRAVGILRRVTPQRKIRLHVVGPAQDKLFYEATQRLVKDLSLEDLVVFTPMVPYDQMWRFYQNADFCLMLSQWESFSRVPLEAMACGSVLITTAAGGGREIVRHGENAIVVPEEAPERVAEEVTGLLESEPDYLRIKQNARAYVEKNHDFESYVSKVEAVLSEAVARGN
jgi:glycosyltransferase involved in cell wall biosynthesis